MSGKEEQEIKRQRLSKEKEETSESHGKALIGNELPGIPVGPTKVCLKILNESVDGCVVSYAPINVKPQGGPGGGGQTQGNLTFSQEPESNSLGT